MSMIPTYQQLDQSLAPRQGLIQAYQYRKGVAEQALNLAVRRPGAFENVIFLNVGQVVRTLELASDFRQEAFDFNVNTTSFGCAGASTSMWSTAWSESTCLAL